MSEAYRPDTLDRYIGQEQVRKNLEVLIGAARVQNRPVDHVLIYGPAGTGKTTIARIIAHETGHGLHVQNGNSIGTVSDMVSVLRHVAKNDVLFIDEAHGMKKPAVELLYTAMEGDYIDLIVGEGVKIPVRIALPDFAVVLATTRPDLLTKSLADRCGSIFRLKLYNAEELARILFQANLSYHINATFEGLAAIAARGRGTPRVALRLLRRVADYATTENSVVTEAVANRALNDLGIDELGLTEIDVEYLTTLIDRFAGGPAGLSPLAAAMPNGATEDEIVGYIEPWLVQIGLVDRTARGRVATARAYIHLKREVPVSDGDLLGRA